MIRFRGLFEIVFAIVLSLTSTTLASAQDQPADVIIKLDKSFWSNVATVIAPITFSGEFSSIAIVDARYCQGADTNVDWVTLLARARPGEARRHSLTDEDCARSTSDVISDPKNQDADAAARLRLAAQPDHQSLILTLPAIASAATGQIPPATLDALKNSQLKIEARDVATAVGGNQGPSIRVTPDIASESLILYLAHAPLEHLPDGMSRPIMREPGLPGNARILVSHKAVGFVISQYLAAKSYPIKGSSFVVSNPTYSAHANSVQVNANVDDKQKGLSFLGAVTWEGDVLKLTNVSGRSGRSCGSTDLVCKAKQAAENVSGQAFAALVRTKYSGSLMLPSTGSQKISFEIEDRKYFIELMGKQSRAQADALFIAGNLYFGVEP